MRQHEKRREVHCNVPGRPWKMIVLLIGLTAVLAGCQGRGETPASGEARATTASVPLDEQDRLPMQASRTLPDPGAQSRIGSRAGPPAPPSPEEVRAKVQASLDKLDDELRTQPEAPAWASRTEAQVASVLSASNLEKEGLSTPASVESRCKMTLCRIGLEFPEGADSEPTVQALMFGIGESLPNAETFQVANPDGSVRFVIYART